MAYQAEIQIGVKGADKLAEFQRTLEETNKVLEITNKTRDVFGMPLQNVQNYTKNLREAAKALQLVEVGTKAETTAIRNYVQAKAEATTISNRHNRLMDEEAQKLGLVTQKLKEYNAAAVPARQVGSMAGAYLRPGEAQLKGQTSNASQALSLAKNRLDVERGIGEVQEHLNKLDQDSIQAHNKRLNLQADYLAVLQRTTNAAKFRAQQPDTQLALPAFQERGLQYLNNSLKLNESQLRIEAALNGERQRGVRFLEKQSAEEKRQLDLGITGQRNNLLPGTQLTGQSSPIQPVRTAEAARAATGFQVALPEINLDREVAQRAKINSLIDDQITFNKKITDGLNRQRAVGLDINGLEKTDVRLLQQQGELKQRELRTEEKIQAAIRRGAEAEKKAQRGKQRRQDALSSGLIGGAFPLLFGQGIGAAAGGGIGGALGGLAGGQMGFALSLVGTQFGTFADQIVGGAATLGQALNPLTADLDAVAEAAGFAGTETAEYLQIIQDLGTEQQALEAATALLAATVGNEGVTALTSFGDETADLGREFARAMALMQTAAARFFGGIPGFIANVIKQNNDLQAGLNLDTPEAKALQKRRNELMGVGEGQQQFGPVTGAATISNMTGDEIKELTETENRLRELGAGAVKDAQDKNKALAETLQTTAFLNKFGIENAELTRTDLKLASQKRDLTNAQYVADLKNQVLQQRDIANINAENAAEKVKGDFLKDNGALQQVLNKNNEDAKNKIAQIDRDAAAANDRKNKKEAAAADRADKAAKRALEAQQKLLTASQNGIAVQQNRLALAKAEGVAEKSLLQFVARKTQIQQSYATKIQAAQKAGGPTEAQTVANLEAERRLALTTNQVQLEQEIKKISEDALKPLNDKIKGYEDQVTFNETYRNLIKEGINPELAKELANIDLIAEKQLELYKTEIESAILAAEKVGDLERQLELEQALIDTKNQIDTKRSEAKTAAKAADAAKPGEIQAYVDQLNEQLANTEAMVVSLAQTVESEIGNAMSSAITGVITGTQTVEEAMSTMFANIGKAFIDMATQMIAKALVMKALGILTGGSTMGGGGYYNPMTGLGTAGPNFGLANGGPTRPNGTYLVGERGPELLTMGNQSGYVHRNTSEAMDRYRAGGSSGGGNGKLDVNYNVTQINGMNFVTEEQFRAGMTKAAKDGAKMGEAGTFKSMRNSRSSRARVGL